jgi:hypothetical protein
MASVRATLASGLRGYAISGAFWQAFSGILGWPVE